jgi:hypothetical protein
MAIDRCADGSLPGNGIGLQILRRALENAVSVASVLLLTEAGLTEIPEKQSPVGPRCCSPKRISPGAYRSHAPTRSPDAIRERCFRRQTSPDFIRATKNAAHLA